MCHIGGRVLIRALSRYSLAKPRAIIMLIQAGRPVDQTIEALSALLSPGDMIVDGGNEWFENTERRGDLLKPKSILYMGSTLFAARACTTESE